MADMIILGGGPAGLTAGLYAARGGADVLLVEELFPGGQAARTERIDNYPGFPDGLEGYAIGAQIEKQAKKFGLQIQLDGVQSLSLEGSEKQVHLVNGETLTAKTVILCTGASPRRLDLPDEERLTGAGISYCATCDGAFFRGKDVAVIGGGDTAVADALYLSRMCASVTVVHRRDTLRAAAALQKAAFDEPKIHFAWDSVVTALYGETALTRLTLRNVKTGEEKDLPVEGAFVAVGITPRTELFSDQVTLAQNGSVQTDEWMATNVPGVFAAGDVRNTPLRQVVTACADGAIAATSAIAYLQTLSK